MGEITKRFLEGIGNVIGAIFKLVFQLERLLGHGEIEPDYLCSQIPRFFRRRLVFGSNQTS